MAKTPVASFELIILFTASKEPFEKSFFFLRLFFFGIRHRDFNGSLFVAFLYGGFLQYFLLLRRKFGIEGYGRSGRIQVLIGFAVALVGPFGSRRRCLVDDVHVIVLHLLTHVFW